MKIQAIDLLQLFKVCCLDYFFVSIGPIMPWKFEIFSPSFSLRNFWKVVSDSFELVSEFLGRWKSNGLSGLSAGDISAFTKYSLFFLKSYKFIFTERATGYIFQNPVGGSFSPELHEVKFNNAENIHGLRKDRNFRNLRILILPKVHGY